MTKKLSLALPLAAMLGVSVSAATMGPQPVGSLTAAQKLAAQGTKSGYVLTGELRSTNGCMDVRFDPYRMQDHYQAVQYRRPGTEHKLCTQIVTWKKAIVTVKGRHPMYVMVHSTGHEDGQRIRVKPWM
jgi:hypothetical protein